MLDDLIKNITGIIWLELEAYYNNEKKNFSAPSSIAVVDMMHTRWDDGGYTENPNFISAMQYRINSNPTDTWGRCSKEYITWRSYLYSGGIISFHPPPKLDIYFCWWNSEVKNSIKVLNQCAIFDHDYLLRYCYSRGKDNRKKMTYFYDVCCRTNLPGNEVSLLPEKVRIKWIEQCPILRECYRA